MSDKVLENGVVAVGKVVHEIVDLLSSNHVVRDSWKREPS